MGKERNDLELRSRRKNEKSDEAAPLLADDGSSKSCKY